MIPGRNMNETEVHELNIRRILPMEMNLVIRNIKSFVFQKEYPVNRTDDRPMYFYLDAATYNNLGDQAISLAIEWFLNDEFGKEHVRVINETDIIGYIQSLKNQIYKEDVIVLGGGGNMGDLYPRYESIRRLVIKSFPDNKIVIFPQTIDYTDDKYGMKEFERAKRVYRAHKKLIICAREKKTLEIFKSFCKNVLLVPDIALYLAGKLLVTKGASSKCGICLREDNESLLDEKERGELFAELKGQSIDFEKITTMYFVEDKLMCFDDRKCAVQTKLEEFAKYKMIITDRLHGMIFSILSNTPCLALDNSNHKVSGVYSTIEKNIIGSINLMGDLSLHEFLDKQISQEEQSGVTGIDFSLIENELRGEQ